MLDRDEDMISTGTRHPFLAKYKVIFILSVSTLEKNDVTETIRGFTVIIVRYSLSPCQLNSVPGFPVCGRPD